MEINYIVTNEKEIDLVKGLWEKLNEHHRKASTYFKPKYEKKTFCERKNEILEKSNNGMVRIELAREPERNGLVAYCISSVVAGTKGEIESIYVEEDYKGLGIGTTLIKNAINWMEVVGAKTKEVTVAEGNEEVFEFYRRCGFYPESIILKQLSK